MRPKKEEAGRKAKEAALERPSVPRDNHGMVDNNDVDVVYYTATEDYFVASFTPMSRKQEERRLHTRTEEGEQQRERGLLEAVALWRHCSSSPLEARTSTPIKHTFCSVNFCYIHLCADLSHRAKVRMNWIENWKLEYNPTRTALINPIFDLPRYFGTTRTRPQSWTDKKDVSYFVYAYFKFRSIYVFQIFFIWYVV